MKKIIPYIFIIVAVAPLIGQADILLDGVSHQIRDGDFTRYIFIKGDKLNSAKSKLEDYGKLAAPRPSTTYLFEFSKVDDWNVIKIPSSTSHWAFHNITFWFLGYGEDDDNHADYVMGLAIDNKQQSRGYIIYGGNVNPRPKDSLHGLTQQETHFFVNIPFDNIVIKQGKHHQNILMLLDNIGFKMPFEGLSLKNKTVIEIEFHESLKQIVH